MCARHPGLRGAAGGSRGRARRPSVCCLRAGSLHRDVGSATLCVDLGRARRDPGAEPVGDVRDEHEVAEGGVRPGGLDPEESAQGPSAVGGGFGEGYDPSRAERDQDPRAASGRQRGDRSLASRVSRVAGRRRGGNSVAQVLVRRSLAYPDRRARAARADRDERAVHRCARAVVDRAHRAVLGRIT